MAKAQAYDIETKRIKARAAAEPETFVNETAHSDEQETPRLNGANNKTASDGADAIVRAAARTIRYLRTALILLILAAAASCGVLIYKLASKNESDSFKYNFNAAATKLTQSFTLVLFENLNHAYILSVALSSRLYVESDYTPSFPNVSIDQIDTIAAAIRNHAVTTDLIWSPLLFTRGERKAWEAYAMGTMLNASKVHQGQYQPCFICGKGYDILYPNSTVTFPGLGPVTCRDLDIGSREGYVGPDACSYYRSYVQSICGCQASYAGVEIDNGTHTPHKAPHGIFRLQDGNVVVDHGPPPYAPVWQISPSLNDENVVMFDQMSEPWRRDAVNNLIDRRTPVFSRTVDATEEEVYTLGKISANGYTASFFYPVFQSLDSDKLAGTLVFDFPWERLLYAILPPSADGITVVLDNTAGQSFTYVVENEAVWLQGQGDLHDLRFDAMVVETSHIDFEQLLTLSSPRVSLNHTLSDLPTCSYRIRVYPTSPFRNSSRPAIYTFIVILAFGVTSLVFFLYDLIFCRIQNQVLDSARRSEEIVGSLFPAVVRERLFGNQSKQMHSSMGAETKRKRISFQNPLMSRSKRRLRTYLTETSGCDVLNDMEPIADLFPNTTIMFADIAGFTAWSSEREPSQVFKLLESLYSEFDRLALELGVFKVETIGDCYVAVTGLPEEMDCHAIVMVEFAFRCLVRMRELFSKLELVLGPGTADLSIRIGLHSGPVTAGVLRGERARFQLFGDTMNVASRMESHGKPGQVHISKETAHLLMDGGNEHLVTRRQDVVFVKGKGPMQTFWAQPSIESRSTFLADKDGTGRSHGHGSTLGSGRGADGLRCERVYDANISNVLDRLVEWNADMLQELLHKIVIHRGATAVKARNAIDFSESANDEESCTQYVDEISEVIEMPDFDEKQNCESNVVDLGPAVHSQLREYVALIASLYRDNPFHNFDHACHVAMSASKLLNRIISPADVECQAGIDNNKGGRRAILKEIHETTFGISSDPIMQFAVVFSALIHDVDHTGLTNQQLVNEKDPIAVKYKGKCVAEQHSIQVAWDSLMQDQFVELRRCIYQNEKEKQRFRQLLVNAVIATDIADKELSAWRKNRWEKVFHPLPPTTTAVVDTEITTRHRKATIVLEYILQASDVAHTMQHWHVYQKWNKRLFDERYSAYQTGREPIDPSIGWHKGELWFFDHYIIPLAKKLEECNVFGVSCTEYLTYALQNRHEWELKGEDIVREMVSHHRCDHRCGESMTEVITSSE